MTTMFLDFLYILMELLLNIVLYIHYRRSLSLLTGVFVFARILQSFQWRFSSLKIRLNHIEAEL